MLGWIDPRPLSSILDQKEARAFAKHFGYRTAEQLLEHYPRGYAAQGSGLDAGTIEPGEIITCVGEIVELSNHSDRNGNTILNVWIFDGTRSTKATFFRAHWLAQRLKRGMRGIFTGKLTYYRGEPNIQHPAFVLFNGLQLATKGMAKMGFDENEITGILCALPYIPIYPAKSAMPTWRIFAAVHKVLSRTREIPELLGRFAPPDLPSFDEAMRGIHQPDARGPEPFRQRLIYDEALSLALVMALRRADSGRRKAPALQGAVDLDLPFALTQGQQAVLDEIRQDMAREVPMQRLLQGEVGSGKTVVALLAMLQCVAAGKQCALLAPTEVLAAQHAQSLAALAKDTKIVLLTGSLNTAQRKQALLDILSGEADIVVGTHALIQDGVEFFDLGCCVVDEQHRFGVEQRDALRGKGRDGLSPHVLVMTATPIPRTIAMTAFGDLEISTLRELPGGRKPIDSFLVPAMNPKWVNRMWERIREDLRQGRQAFVVCSKIGGEDGVEAQTELLQRTEFSEFRVGMVHGQLTAEEKAATMEAFARGEIDVLVATTVIEVGIDVPNATVMLIRNAEAFGVSQLHQLRGRVGRGGNKSICFFYTFAEEDSKALERVGRVAATTDGFELAEIDLEFRQEGDVLGTQQSGRGTLRLLSFTRDRAMIERANADAAVIVAHDPELARELVADIDSTRQTYLDKN